MRPHPRLPTIRIVADEPVAYDALPMSRDIDFIGQLKSRYVDRVESHTFRLVEVPVAIVVEMAKTESLAFYARLAADGVEDGARRYARIRQLCEQIRAGVMPDPIAISVDYGWIQLLDGFHRVAAASETDVGTLVAFERIHPDVA